MASCSLISATACSSGLSVNAPAGGSWKAEAERPHSSALPISLMTVLCLRREPHRRDPNRRAATPGVEGIERREIGGIGALAQIRIGKLASNACDDGIGGGGWFGSRARRRGLAVFGALGAGTVAVEEGVAALGSALVAGVGAAGCSAVATSSAATAAGTSNANTRARPPAAMTAIYDRPCMRVSPEPKEVSPRTVQPPLDLLKSHIAKVDADPLVEGTKSQK